MPGPRAAVVDVLAVLVFVAVGRTSHAEGVTVGGVASTAWPFLVGLVLGWVVAASTGRRSDGVAAGAAVWACVVTGGLALRSASGGGTAPSFVVVTTVALAVLLLGGRLVGGAPARLRPGTARP